MTQFTEREWEVLVAHYALPAHFHGDHPGETLASIGARLGVTAPHVRWIARRAVRRSLRRQWAHDRQSWRTEQVGVGVSRVPFDPEAAKA
jgi:DNA-directed RNA polymerase sigma subunit (sigma70/sigma32)